MIVTVKMGMAAPDTCVGAIWVRRDANQKSQHLWRKASRKRRYLEEREGRYLSKNLNTGIIYEFKCLITGIEEETPSEVLLQLQGFVIYDALFGYSTVAQSLFSSNANE